MNVRLKSLATAALTVALCAAAGPAWSLDQTQASTKDKRVRFADYDPDEVYLVNTSLGVATHIQLNDDEDYVTHAFGDSAAYAFTPVGKHLLLKPRVEQADTNLNYITTKRNYTFLLKYAKERKGGDVYRISMRYPENERAKTAKQEDAALVQQELGNSELAINWQSYTMSGDASIGPEAAWDDGAQTSLRFAPGQDLPSVYFVDSDGQEVIANRHMDGERTIVLHRVASRWHLRLGNKVVAVHNEAPVAARSLSTGTISPAVERVLREESSR
ncbi:TrbG/VirB9 family P-type conjugative transfer protein [Achromobacter ruhlandii]|uniref:TrbG/VirB9 family P-type conjugative transfer protein n=1 Tax=Achromobacter ruhlandii TaxID=72557 RepID=UPI0007BF1839|nr:TrbG/VirB9 family P-type conjugative transfer protein [Achromobacter ruhlandii]